MTEFRTENLLALSRSAWEKVAFGDLRGVPFASSTTTDDGGVGLIVDSDETARIIVADRNGYVMGKVTVPTDWLVSAVKEYAEARR